MLERIIIYVVGIWKNRLRMNGVIMNKSRMLSLAGLWLALSGSAVFAVAPYTNNLVCHFDGDCALYTDNDGTVPAKIGEHVRRWDDIATAVGGNNNVQQDANDDDQPLLWLAGKAEGLNGPHRVLYFDGVNDNLLAMRAGAGLANSDAFDAILDTDQQTWFIVMRKMDLLGNETIYRPSTDTNATHWGTFCADATLTSNARSDAGTYRASSGTISSGEFFIVSARWDGDNDSLEQWVNGVSTGENTDDSTSTVAFSRFRLGANANGGQYFNGDIAEVLIYNTALSVSNRTQVESYLNSKYFGTYTNDTVAHYEFREKESGGIATVGAAIKDDAGHHNGTVEGASLNYVDGDPDYGDVAAFQFDHDASSNRVVLADDADFRFNGSFTIEALVKTTTTGIDAIVAKNGVSGSQWWFRLYQGRLQFNVTDEQVHWANIISDTGEKANSGDWTHVAAVYDSDDEEMRLYIGYGLVQSLTNNLISGINSPIGSNPYAVVIGGFYNTGDRDLNGDIDFVRISNGALEPYQFKRSVTPLILGTVIIIK